ncbi:hypothetical protein [Paenibacillus glacialis]|uniref:Uncharacterized protein n=1 Tax=Paenibacillus glacialis TaxID=494026 RepID=A0A168DL78_9BACL|nr:hypothetical protein [Paenibacillus glacialis]OAB34311.1 hypothetical protein PGLA_22780 [Paenibacillus glacialis]
MISKIIKDGYRDSVEEDSFSHSAYFHTPSEIKSLPNNAGVNKLEHVSTDEIGVYMKDTINQLSEEKYNLWVEAHLKTCSELLEVLQTELLKERRRLQSPLQRRATRVKANLLFW